MQKYKKKVKFFYIFAAKNDTSKYNGVKIKIIKNEKVNYFIISPLRRRTMRTG